MSKYPPYPPVPEVHTQKAVATEPQPLSHPESNVTGGELFLLGAFLVAAAVMGLRARFDGELSHRGIGRRGS